MTAQPPVLPPPPPYGPPPYGPASGAFQAIPTTRQTSISAVISLVAGLTWWFWVGSIAAVVLGHIARKECREQGYGGDTLAIFGLVLGYIGLATFAMALGSMWLGTMGG